ALPDNDSTRSPLADDPSISGDDGEQNVAGTTGTTKKRRLGTKDFTRRKRAVTACQFCRVRKTRCDNSRPRCGYCTRHKARCIYGEEMEEPFTDTGSAADLSRVTRKFLRSWTNSKTCCSEDRENTSTTPRTMPDDQFIHFSKRFLAIVHPRNPILDGNELLRHARLIEENGLQWDSASCLVLIACALGSYTLPWVKPSQIPHIVDAWQGSTVIEKDNRATAEAYYAAALKRVGPLEPPKDLEFTATKMSPGTGESPNGVDDTQSRINERGWCYYLSEISLRRTIDETVDLLYRKGEAYWLQNSSQLVRHYWGSERQIASWQYHIPAIVKFNNHEPPDEEFACYLWFRALEWREYTLRPILYCVLHSTPERATTVEEKELAQAALKIYETVIPQKLYALRHGGSWFAARSTFTSAALILAVVINPSSGLVPSKRWPSLVQSAIWVLQYWGQVARDIRLAATILTEMYEKTRQHIEYTYTD
ncbi:hypothetical protein BN1723_006672, partial [Verticillium longisporum]